MYMKYSQLDVILFSSRLPTKYSQLDIILSLLKPKLHYNPILPSQNSQNCIIVPRQQIIGIIVASQQRTGIIVPS